MAAAMTPAMFFDFLAVRLNGPEAAGKALDLNFSFTDTGEHFAVSVRRAVLVARPGRRHASALATLTMARRILYGIAGGAIAGRDAVADGRLKVDGAPAALAEFMALFDTFDPWFGVATP